MLRWSIVPVLVACAGIYAWLDPENGVAAWLEHRAHLREARARIEAIRSEMADREARGRALSQGAFAVERAIREELGFARPGEVVVRLPRTDRPIDPLP